MTIEKVQGQLCWTLESAGTKVAVTIQAGNLTCDFNLNGRIVNPYFVFPWWNEQISFELDSLSQVMRGDFFCFPFGADDGSDPVTYHGPTASEIWTPAEEHAHSPGKLDLQVKLRTGSVTKHIELHPGETVVYQRHTVSGYGGSLPFGYHPILRFPDAPGSGLISVSRPTTALTAPEPVETAETGGYSCLKPGEEFTDISMVPCTDGSTLDVGIYPHAETHEDIVLFVCDDTLDFAWSAVTFPSDRYVYFQLKDPRMLRQTLLWMSNGGRSYPPWDGRIRGVLGVEEVTAYFHYGKSASVEANPLSDAGVPTTREFRPDEETHISLVSGAAEVPASFGRVEQISQTGDREITIRDASGSGVRIPCDPGFLKQGSGTRERA